MYSIINTIHKNYGTKYTAYGFATDKDSTFFSIKAVLEVEARLYQKSSTVLFASKNSKYIEEKDVPKDVLKAINEGVSRLFKDIEKIFKESEKIFGSLPN
jgi:hypothetical protein